MVELLLIVVVLIFGFGMAHVGPINVLMWLLDHADDADELPWSLDAFMSTMLVPTALIIVSVELYFLMFSCWL